ncbi:MAG: dienelactone hydrolase family protein [Longimicrobiales bacterium]
MRRTYVFLTLALVACGAPAEDRPEGETAASVVPDGPRVPIAPTALGQLPPAILGEGGALQGTNVQYLAADPSAMGYLAVPEGAGPFPALVIVHEWNGLVDRVRQVADDFAAEGYITLAVDLFSGRVGNSAEENMALVQEARGNMPRVISNLDGAVAYLKSRPDVTGRVGAMGWCFGGGIALSFGLDGVEHEATAIFYGALVDDPEVLRGMSHEVYGTFARLDSGPSPEQVAAFETAARSAGIANDLHIYDAVGHGFWLRVDEDPAVRAAPALDAWQRLKNYLGRTVG